MPEPWGQMPDEPPEAYARFLVYRNLGPARASKELAAALVMAPPTYIAGLTVAGGMDDLVRSHVPLALSPWAATWSETLSEN